MCMFVISPAFAEEDWLIAETDKPQYHTGEDMVISGYISERKMPVIAVSIYDPDGTILSANNVEIDSDDGFSKTVSLDSPFYDKSGLYTIEFKYGPNTDSVLFEMIGSTIEEPKENPDLPPEVLLVSTDKATYFDNEFVTISGLVSDIGDPTILIGIYDPNNFPVGFYTPEIGDDLEFSVSFLAKNGVNFKTVGTYSVKAHYGQSKQTTSFSFMDKPPQQNVPVQQPVQTNNPTQSVIIPVPQPKPEIKNTQTIQVKSEIPSNNIPQTSINQESTTRPIEESSDNLSVEDKELGEILNEITLNCANNDYVDTILYNEGMGAALMRLCNYDQAISYFDRTLTSDPNNVEVLTNKATALGKIGKIDSALRNYNLALAIEPNFIPALNNKANILAGIGKLDEAISIYNKILDLDPSYSISQDNLQKARDDLDHNIKMKEKIIQVKPVPENNTVQIPKAEPDKIIYENPKKSSNVIEQIGVFFAGVFGFLK